MTMKPCTAINQGQQKDITPTTTGDPKTNPLPALDTQSWNCRSFYLLYL